MLLNYLSRFSLVFSISSRLRSSRTYSYWSILSLEVMVLISSSIYLTCSCCWVSCFCKIFIASCSPLEALSYLIKLYSYYFCFSWLISYLLFHSNSWFFLSMTSSWLLISYFIANVSFWTFYNLALICFCSSFFSCKELAIFVNSENTEEEPLFLNILICPSTSLSFSVFYFSRFFLKLSCSWIDPCSNSLA